MKENPYRYKGPLDPIRDQLVLVPRTHDLERVCEGIANGEYWVILGPRQIGKTTFLQQIESKMENTLNLYFSFEVCPTKEKNFYQWLFEIFLKEIPSGHKKYTKKKWRVVDTASKFFRFLEEFKPKKDIQKILLLFEEIEGIGALRSFLQIWGEVYTSREEGLRKYAVVITAGSNELISLLEENTSPFNIANRLYMRDFSQEESRRLIDGSFAQLKIKITSNAKEKLLSQVSGHPQLLQHTCHLLVEIAVKETRTIIEKDIDEVIRTLFKTNTMIATLKTDVTGNIPLKTLIKDIFAGKKIPFHLNKEYSIKGAGCIVKDEQGNCAIRNKVYERFLKDFLSLHSQKKPVVFISYSRKDKKWKDKFLKHLSVLESQNIIIWNDMQIPPGEDWSKKIQESINAANVAIFLISANSLTSVFTMGEEIPLILRRKEKEGIFFFPVLVEHCAWKSVKWLGRMQIWPKDGKPLGSMSSWEQDRILGEIVNYIFDYLTSSPIEEQVSKRDRILEADDSESKARKFISECNYPEGGKCLVEASNYDPDRKERLSKEFGFLYDFSDSWEKDKEYQGQNKEQIKWG